MDYYYANILELDGKVEFQASLHCDKWLQLYIL